MKLKRHFLFILTTPLLAVCMLVPFATFTSCTSSGKELKSEESVTHNFPAVRCSRRQGDIILSVSVVYRGQDKGAEITEREAELIGIIRNFGSSIDDADLTDVQRYQGSHEKLKVMFNKILKKGKVETVVFRSVGKQ
jgi:hypothetical protein